MDRQADRTPFELWKEKIQEILPFLPAFFPDPESLYSLEILLQTGKLVGVLERGIHVYCW
jgi:hypothetical protein